MDKASLPYKINFFVFIITLFLNLTIQWIPSVWQNFGDPYDYLYQSQKSLTDKEFYSPQKTTNFYPRPFTVPLFYKISGSNPDVIIQMQKLVHSLSAFFLVYAFFLFIQSNVIRYILMFCIYLLMSWWNILGWTIVLLSESLSFSLMFCWIASFLVLLKKKDTFSLVTHLIITLLFSFTRDTWPYIIVAFYCLFAFSFYFFEKQLFRKGIFLVIFSVILFFIQQSTAEAGSRYKLPLINSIVLRILPNQQYTQWFVERGMPESERLKEMLSGINPIDDSRIKLYDFYKDTSFLAFNNWIISEGKSTYIKFLITHPSYSFFFQESKEQLNRIFAYNLYYPGKVKGYSRGVQYVFPLFNALVVLILCILLVLLFLKSKLQILLVPVFISVVFILNIILLYNADALEVERHLFVTHIIIQLVGFVSLALIFDNVSFTKFSGKTKRVFNNLRKK